MEWNNEITLEFLSLYEKYPVLWDPKNAKYKNRKKLSEAWELIMGELSVDFPITSLKRKKECLMTTYRSLRKKVLQHERFGVVYKPTWFAYEQMDKFLKGIRGGCIDDVFGGRNGIRISSGRAMVNGKLNDEDYEDEDDDEEKEGYFDPLSLQDLDYNSFIMETNGNEVQGEQLPFIQNIREEVPTSSTKKTSKKKRRHLSKHSKSSSLSDKKITKRIDHASDVLQSINEQLYQQQQNESDECSLYGKLLINRLRDLDKNVRTIVMNSIDNLIFRAQMGEIRVIQSSATLSTPSTATTTTTTATASTTPTTTTTTTTSLASAIEVQEANPSNNNHTLSVISNSNAFQPFISSLPSQILLQALNDPSSLIEQQERQQQEQKQKHQNQGPNKISCKFSRFSSPTVTRFKRKRRSFKSTS